MAQGDSKQFRDWGLKKDKGDYASTDTYSLVFISDQYSTIDINTADPQLSDFTVVSGGNIPAATNLANFTVTRSGADVTFDADDPATFSKDPSNPATCKSILIINNTSVNDDAMQVVDATADGTTAIDLVNNDLVFSFSASGITVGTYN